MTTPLHPPLPSTLDAEPETGLSRPETAVATLKAGRMRSGVAVHVGMSGSVQTLGVVLPRRKIDGPTFDTDIWIAARHLIAMADPQRPNLRPQTPLANQYPSWSPGHDLDLLVSTNFQRGTEVGTPWPFNYEAHEALDEDMLRSVLVNVSKSDRYEVPLEHNAPAATTFDLLPHTTDSTPALDAREVAILESTQQRDAILLARDFRAALRTLAEEEQFSSHDLTQLIGVTRAVLMTWRDRPLEKIRQVNQAAMGRLLFAWKYWLHVTEGELLGRYLRHVPEQSVTSLLRLLADHQPTDDEIARHIDRLAKYAASDRKAAALRRRDLGGLPLTPYQHDRTFD